MSENVYKYSLEGEDALEKGEEETEELGLAEETDPEEKPEKEEKEEEITF